MLTHEKIRIETEQIIKLLATSDRPVTPFFHILKPGLTLMVIPNLLATILLILEWYNGDITSGVEPGAYLGNLVISFLLAAMLSPYANFYYMLSMKDVEKFEIVKVLRQKIKIYFIVLSIVWILASIPLMILGGGVMVIPIMVMVTFILGMFVFSLDISRYQLSGVFGALNGVKDIVTKDGQTDRLNH
ncbi:conjugal transfer entry exclusion protein TraS [Klebsiella pneumoniae]|nr:conjugal transfer entry exclusion protein TraS [Klebsiella pneumoniae]